MVSFDSVSLFANVALPEVIDLIINCLYNIPNINNIPIPKEVFRKYMFIATRGIFMYNGRFYEKIDGGINGLTSWPNPG